MELDEGEVENVEDVDLDIRKRAAERELCREFFRRIPHMLGVKELRAIDVVVLHYIANAAFPRVADLVKDLGLRQSQASDVVQSLVDRGRVKRSNVKAKDRKNHHERGDGADARERYLELTPKGLRLLTTTPAWRTSNGDEKT